MLGGSTGCDAFRIQVGRNCLSVRAGPEGELVFGAHASFEGERGDEMLRENMLSDVAAVRASV